jgi:hypothetical protein
LLPGKQHHQAVNTYSETTCRRHPVLQRLKKIFVGNFRFLIAGLFC